MLRVWQEPGEDRTAAVSAAQYRLSWTGTGHTQTPGRNLQRSARGRGADPSQDLGMRGGVIGGTGSLGTDREGRRGSLEQMILNQHIIIEDTPPPLPAAECKIGEFLTELYLVLEHDPVFLFLPEL